MGDGHAGGNWRLGVGNGDVYGRVRPLLGRVHDRRKPRRPVADDQEEGRVMVLLDRRGCRRHRGLCV